MMSNILILSILCGGYKSECIKPIERCIERERKAAQKHCAKERDKNFKMLESQWKELCEEKNGVVARRMFTWEKCALSGMCVLENFGGAVISLDDKEKTDPLTKEECLKVLETKKTYFNKVREADKKEILNNCAFTLNYQTAAEKCAAKLETK